MRAPKPHALFLWFISWKSVLILNKALVFIFSKGEKANLSQAERNELKQILGALAETYREGVKRNVKSRK